MKQPARASLDKKPAAKTKRKTRDDVNNEARDRKRDKKHRGNASGSRANPVVQKQKGSSAGDSKDPRIGSKKPVPLVADGTSSKPSKPVKASQPVEKKKPRLSPQEELTALENDERLDTLLDRLENGETLSAEEQAWLDETLDRIDVLMEELGIALDEGAEDEEAEEDMYRLLKGGQ